MLAKFLGKLADLPRKWAVVYLIGLVACYLAGMTLVLYGIIVVGNGTRMDNAYFYAGLVIWIPTCVASVLTSVSSNYGKEIEAKEAEMEEAIKGKRHEGK